MNDLRNPYSPPEAAVGDVPGDGDSAGTRTRPREVELAFRLMAGCAALGIVNFFLMGMQDAGTALFVLAVITGFAFAIRAGQNWARILFTILYVVGLAGLFAIPSLLALGGVLFVLIFIAQTLMQAFAIWLVFREPGAGWFRKAERT